MFDKFYFLSFWWNDVFQRYHSLQYHKDRICHLIQVSVKPMIEYLKPRWFLYVTKLDIFSQCTWYSNGKVKWDETGLCHYKREDRDLFRIMVKCDLYHLSYNRLKYMFYQYNVWLLWTLCLSQWYWVAKWITGIIYITIHFDINVTIIAQERE